MHFGLQLNTVFWERERFSVLATAGHGFSRLADIAVYLSDTSVVDGSSSGLPSLKECGADTTVCKWP